MKIAVIGATGKAGSLIVKEAKERGHDVTAIVRNASKVTDVPAVEKDIFDITSEDIKDFDVVVNAFGTAPGEEHKHVEAGKVLINALKEAPNTRLIVVGGAGSLFVDEAKTTRLFDTPDFPKEYLPVAKSSAQNLQDLENSEGIQWTYISPAAFFDPQGPRTGEYKVSGDVLAVNSEGQSYISYRDYAIALVDEIENRKHINKRFSVVSK
ncbi:NAD(P)-dependent oxidoreductase [Aeribacillus pallidus]|jgi:Putative NADH-flavin reductase|uniref:NAD(P)-dependent oxidoreductase n=1 Tax=Aeribacillus pallidus TaxID=33936 RepID=UPI000E342D4F|nr:NAD(P)-dependent oxidoreductase [Aeribacillus pallidus]